MIELTQTRQDELLTILNAEPSTSSLVSIFVQAYINKTTEMLDGQFASALVPLIRLTSPDIFYVLSGNDLSLDINDPSKPAILCLGGEPARQQALAPVMSLFIDRLNNRVNQAGRHPSALILDEFGTVRAASVLTTFATARSNDVSTIISVQDLSQLQTQYSNAEARQIMNSTGNLLCGMISGETAGLVSDRFASTIQYKTTIAVNSADTSVSKSEQTMPAITPATLANLSSGEFVGIVADDPKKRIEKKGFHAEILIEEDWRNRLGMHPVPKVRRVTNEELQANFNKIKTDIQI
ncbi:MAG: TraM recognition domain-containing protein, partial [Bacteroidetes bacterium]|nr:TraM recognition domain-containing protein [Bacteroidota bacterium]